MIQIPKIIIAGIGSGAGKTTLTCGLLKCFERLGKQVAPFKCGPDYIDPMFHKEVLGIDSYNLDLFMMGVEGCARTLDSHSQGKDLVLIEGVMGFYDGIGSSTESSAYELSCELGIPVILVVSCQGMGLSVAAMIQGYLDFRPNHVKGIILNHVSEMTYTYYKNLIEKNTATKVLGYMPYIEECQLESRHLGLVTAQEVDHLASKIDVLAHTLSKTVDLKGLLEMAQEDVPVQKIALKDATEKKLPQKIRIGIAWDKAFCFYYKDNLELLESMGVELVKFSPLVDQEIPPDLCGLILGGGYPELYLEELRHNQKMKTSITSALENQMPCIAECGGFMYLGKTITNLQGESYEMVGYLDGESVMTKKLRHFGYVNLTCQQAHLLGEVGEVIRAHEFHYSASTQEGQCYEAKKPLSDKGWQAIMANDYLFAGYPHIHWVGQEHLAQRFVEACDAHHLKTRDKKRSNL